MDIFCLFRFYLQLIISYELYVSESYEESLLEIESIVKSMETYKFDDSNQQYSDAYYHVARSTNAFIALTLNVNCDEVNLCFNSISLARYQVRYWYNLHYILAKT